MSGKWGVVSIDLKKMHNMRVETEISRYLGDLEKEGIHLDLIGEICDKPLS